METKNNTTVYLKDGRKANYECKINKNKHLVKVYTLYEGYDNQYEGLGEAIVVDEVFKEVPIQIVSERIKQLEEEKKNLTKEVQQLNIDKRELTNYITQKTSFKKHIINKKELMSAKSLVFFKKGWLTPETINQDGLRGLKIGLNISVFNNEERAWGYKLYFDYGDYSEFIVDHNENILVNKTQEEIDEAIRSRIDKIEDPTTYSKRAWLNIDDKYLTKEFLEFKKNIIKKEKERKKANKLEKIEQLKKEIIALEA